MNARLLIAAFLIAVTSVTAQQPLSLNLGRKIKEFDRYQYTTRHSDQQQMLTKLPTGRVLDSTTLRVVDLVAVVDVKSVTVDGEEREKSLDIRQFDVTTDGVRQRYLAKGTTISAVFSDSGSVFTIGGKPVADSVFMVLNDVVHREGGEKTGRILGTKKAVKTGDKWSMNVPALLSTIDRNALRIDKKNVKGSVELLAIDTTEENGVIAIVSGTAKATKVRPAGLDDLQLGDVHMNMAFTVTVPIDNRLPPVGSSSVIALDIPARMKTPDGQTIGLQIRSIRQQESRFER
jgi:hypothetical protein